MIEGKRIVITGGAGFIGCTLAGRLVAHNKIRIFDNLSRNALRVKPYRTHPNLELIIGDVLDPDHLAEAFEGAHIIVHCAAVAGIDTVIKSAVQTMRVNIVGSANVLEAAARLPACERVVCFSTSEVFGRQSYLSSEGDSAITGQVGEARWTYAVSKLAEEHLAIAYYKELQVPTTVVRPFNVYGPGQVGDGALKTFIQRAIANETLYVHGDGTQIRAWCYIEDMVEGVLATMEHPNALGESFNIGNQRAIETIYGLANTVIRVLNSKSSIEFLERDTSDVELRVPSVTKAHRLLGFKAKVDLEEGIVRTADWYRSQSN